MCLYDRGSKYGRRKKRIVQFDNNFNDRQPLNIDLNQCNMNISNFMNNNEIAPDNDQRITIDDAII